MKTNRALRGQLPSFFAFAIFSTLVLSVAQAEDPEKMALNKPEKIIGNWQSLGGSDTVTTTFTEKGEFEFGGTENGNKVVLMKGTYTVDAASWPLKLTFVSGGKKSYGAIAVVSADRIMLEKLATLDEKPMMDGNALTLARQPGALAASSETSATHNPAKLIGKWKSIGDPVALEGAAMTMSYTDKGEFEMTMSEKGEEQTFKGTYTVNAAGSPLKIAAVVGDKKIYYALAILPNDQIKIEEIKTADGDFEDFGENSISLARVISPLPVIAAKKPEIIAKIEALNKPENLIGTWKSTGAPAKLAGETLTLSFSDKAGLR